MVEFFEGCVPAFQTLQASAAEIVSTVVDPGRKLVFFKEIHFLCLSLYRLCVEPSVIQKTDAKDVSPYLFCSISPMP